MPVVLTAVSPKDYPLRVGRGREKSSTMKTRSGICGEVDMLKTVLLIMRRASLAQGLMANVRDAPGIQLCYEPGYANGDVAIRAHLPGPVRRAA